MADSAASALRRCESTIRIPPPPERQGHGTQQREGAEHQAETNCEGMVDKLNLVGTWPERDRPKSKVSPEQRDLMAVHPHPPAAIIGISKDKISGTLDVCSNGYSLRRIMLNPRIARK